MGCIHVQAQKGLVDIDRRPHKAVRAYASAQEKELLTKASSAASTAIQINAQADGIGAWVYKSLGLA